MNKAQINEQIRATINEILNETSKIVCKNLKETNINPETIKTLTKALETGLCAAQRFEIISCNCVDVLYNETELTLIAIFKNTTDVIRKILGNEDINAETLLELIKLLELTSNAWRRLYNFGIANPYHL